MSGIGKAYHAKRVIKLGGRRLAGWTPKQVADLQKRQRSKTVIAKPARSTATAPVVSSSPVIGPAPLKRL